MSIYVLFYSPFLFQSTRFIIHFICTESSIQYEECSPHSDFPVIIFVSVYSLELDRNCRFDFTAVYDGPTTNTGLIGKVCGRTQTSFESSSNAMTVVLSTDDSNSYRGFSAQYTSVPLPAPVQPDGECTRYEQRVLFLILTHSSFLPL